MPFEGQRSGPSGPQYFVVYNSAASGCTHQARAARPEGENVDLGIKGRAAIVTGASRGIGFETARQFLEEGVRVMICGRNAETLEKTRAELQASTGGEIHATVADM